MDSAESLSFTGFLTPTTEKRVQLDPRFECPICLNCLKEPYLTSCGHRFCQECILEWLRKKNRRCPVDGNDIEEKDLFPDNYTRREITHQTVQCTFPNCNSVTPLLELEKHVAENHEIVKSSGVCLNGMDTMAKEADTWDAPPKQQNTTLNQLIMSLCERVVQLEQKTREQELQLVNAKTKINDMVAEKEQFMAVLPLRICNGSHIWNVPNIREQLHLMYKDPSKMLYSEGFYTSYHGYKFCARLNVSPNNSSYISLLVHLMKSENDDILPWPFKGRIAFTLIHPSVPEHCLSEVMCTKPGLKAFEKPNSSISPRAFGYTEFTLIDDIVKKGYISESGSLIIKIDINCV